MPSRTRLHRRIDQVQAVTVDRGRQGTAVDWSALTVAELERLEKIAVRAAPWANRRAFLTALDAEEQRWLDQVARKTGLVAGRGT